MQRILTVILFFFSGIPLSRAQLQVEAIPLGGYPFMLKGSNNKDYGAVTGRLQISYKGGQAPWQAYLAASMSPLLLPLHSRQINSLSLYVLNTAFKAGLSGDLRNNEERRSIWSISGGIGVCMLRPDDATLTMNGQATYLSYTPLKDKAWFPEVELGMRWVHQPKEDLGWYFGFQVLVESIWLKDEGIRYTTEISGTTYNLSFDNIVLWPSLGGVIGWRF